MAVFMWARISWSMKLFTKQKMSKCQNQVCGVKQDHHLQVFYINKKTLRYCVCVCVCVCKESLQESRGLILSRVTRVAITHMHPHTHTRSDFSWECLIGHCEPAGMLSSRGDSNQAITPAIWPSQRLRVFMCVCCHLCCWLWGDTARWTVIKAETKKERHKERPRPMKTYRWQHSRRSYIWQHPAGSSALFQSTSFRQMTERFWLLLNTTTETSVTYSVTVC